MRWRIVLDGYHRFPLVMLGRVEDRVADGLGFEGIAESRGGRLVLGQVVEKVGDLMHERVFIANLKAGNPPLLHVWHVAVGDVH